VKTIDDIAKDVGTLAIRGAVFLASLPVVPFVLLFAGVGWCHRWACRKLGVSDTMWK